MSSKPRKWKFRLRHILEAIERIEHYTASLSAGELQADREKQDAVVWNLTVIGEAARQIPETVAQRYPEVPWPQMRGIRNRIVHGYDQINFDIIWNVIRNELPPLVPALKRIIEQANEEGGGEAPTG